MKTIYSPEYKSLLVWLRESRTGKGMTMRTLAGRLGVPHSWVGKVEIGERRLDVAEFVHLCRAMNADPHAGLEILLRAMPPAPALPMVAEKRGPYRVRRRNKARISA